MNNFLRTHLYLCSKMQPGLRVINHQSLRSLPFETVVYTYIYFKVTYSSALVISGISIIEWAPFCTFQTPRLVPYRERNLYQLMLTYVSGTYEAREEYLVYDTGSMIGDVGGYLGLLLGYSIYSVVVDMITALKHRIEG